MKFQDYAPENVKCRQDGCVAVITLNRPEAMNAISRGLEAELHSALDIAEQDPSVRAIVITGEGRAFSAGYDLGSEEEQVPENSRAADALNLWWSIDMKSPQHHWHIMRLDKPVIAAINGWCLGGAFWYALCADITIASDMAVFAQPEIREIQNSSFLFPALVGWKHAHRYALTGDHFDAKEAERIGVVNEVVAHDDLMPTAIALGKRLGLVPETSVKLNKAITTLGLEAMGLRSAMEIASAISVITHASNDSRELDDMMAIRKNSGMRESLKFRDSKFLPEPGGPRSAQ